MKGVRTAGGYEGATIAHLWEHPDLCIAVFGIQFHKPVGQERYAASGITQEMDPALEAAKEAGSLHQERLMGQGSGVLLQYWRSYDELDHWARTMPHFKLHSRTTPSSFRATRAPSATCCCAR